MLSLCEIKESLQGEGKFTGIPTTFIRLYGCNLYCPYCDTKYAKDGKRRNASIETIMNTVYKIGNKHVCITGGEPMIQDDFYPLLYELVEKGYVVDVETNGSIHIDRDEYNRSYCYCMDIKCPSSNMSKHNKYSNLENLQPKDEVKFVISDYADYLFAKGVIKQYPTKASFIFSPCFDAEGKSNAKELSEWLLTDKIPNARLGIQIHKTIGIY